MDSIEFLDLNSKEKKFLKNNLELKTKLSHLDAVYKDGEIYIIGGNDGYTENRIIKVIDVASNSLYELGRDYERLYSNSTYKKCFMVNDSLCIGCTLDSMLFLSVGKGISNKELIKKQLEYHHRIQGKALPESKIESFIVFEV